MPAKRVKVSGGTTAEQGLLTLIKRGFAHAATAYADTGFSYRWENRLAENVVVHHQRAVANRKQQAQGSGAAKGLFPLPHRAIKQETNTRCVLREVFH